MTFLQDLAAPVFYAGLGLLVFLAGAMLAAAVFARRNARALGAAPPVDPSHLSPGYRLVSGRAAGPELVAPLTGRSCAWYDLTVWKSERRVVDGEARFDWEEIRTETSDRLLAITDGRTRCVVDAWGAQVYPSDWSEWKGRSETPTDRDPPLQPGTETPGGGLQVDVQGGTAPKYRYRERYVRLNDPVFALGDVSRTDTAPPADDAEEPEDEDISEDEYWQDEQQRLADLAGAPWQVSKPKRRPFILSTRPPEQLGQESELASRAGLWFGLALAALALGLVWLRLG